MSLLDEFSKQLSSATEQLNRLERMENEQQENSENATTTQQKQQSRSKQQRTPYGAGGYSRLHERKTSSLSSEAAKPTVANIDPIAAKHLQPHPIRYAKTTITDRLDSKTSHEYYDSQYSVEFVRGCSSAYERELRYSCRESFRTLTAGTVDGPGFFSRRFCAR